MPDVFSCLTSNASTRIEGRLPLRSETTTENEKGQDSAQDKVDGNGEACLQFMRISSQFMCLST